MDIKWIKNRIKKESVFFIFLGISCILHISSYLNLKSFTGLWEEVSKENAPFNLNMDDSLETQKLVQDAKKLYEAQKEANQKPDKADYLGFQNHTAKKEQRVDTKYSLPLLDSSSEARSSKMDSSLDDEGENYLKKESGEGKRKTELGNLYKKFMPKLNDGSGIKLGQGSHVDDLPSELEEGEYTDVNTLEYKNMGYFVGMRKALESVWVYPSDAKRYGYQGVVGITFNLQKDGSVTGARILKSSGYKSLDIYALRALNEASFAPPPEEVYKKSPFYWTFRYQIY